MLGFVQVSTSVRQLILLRLSVIETKNETNTLWSQSTHAPYINVGGDVLIV
jgi:hypothetical protein